MKVMPEAVEFIGDLFRRGMTLCWLSPRTFEDWRTLQYRVCLSFCIIPVGADFVTPLAIAIPTVLVGGPKFAGAWLGLIGLVATLIPARPRWRRSFPAIGIALLVVSLCLFLVLTQYKVLLVVCSVPFALLCGSYVRAWIAEFNESRPRCRRISQQ